MREVSWGAVAGGPLRCRRLLLHPARSPRLGAAAAADYVPAPRCSHPRSCCWHSSSGPPSPAPVRRARACGAGCMAWADPAQLRAAIPAKPLNAVCGPACSPPPPLLPASAARLPPGRLQGARACDACARTCCPRRACRARAAAARAPSPAAERHGRQSSGFAVRVGPCGAFSP